ncbi:MAG: NADH-quinone oxidoreductase subunit K [Planctomycetota bacterium]|nr:NADH-quinone oxidoreductase subunit K [Planctomycetota bacterium]
MATWLALLCGLLATVGTRLMLRPKGPGRALGIVLLGLAVNLLVFTMTGAVHGRAPLVEPGASSPEPPYADPVPQALVLTAIVIGFALQAFALVLLVLRAPNDPDEEAQS